MRRKIALREYSSIGAENQTSQNIFWDQLFFTRGGISPYKIIVSSYIYESPKNNNVAYFFWYTIIKRGDAEECSILLKATHVQSKKNAGLSDKKGNGKGDNNKG